MVQIGLTEKGDTLREHATQIHCDMKQAIGLTDDQFAALQASLRRLTANVGE